MKRFTTALMLGTAACLATPAAAFDITAMSAEEKTAFGQAVREYMIENPEVLIEVISTLEARQAEDAAKTDQQLIADNSDALYNDGFSWVGGNPEGDLTMVEFIDYRCGVCRQFNTEVHEAVENDGNIRLVLKEFPILGEDSVRSSRFAIAVLQVAGSDAYEQAHHALMALRSPATDTALEEIANDIGVDSATVMAKMDSDDVTNVLRENQKLGQQMAIQGTPSFVIGDQFLRGVPRAGISQTIAEVRENM